MTLDLTNLALKINSAIVTRRSRNFRPRTWPPAPDWPVVIDKDDKTVSVWSDSVWDISCWGGKPAKLNFGDGPPSRAAPIDAQNGHQLRQSIGWLILGPRGYTNAGTISNRFSALRVIFALCSEHKIPASSLARFAKVVELLPKVIAPSKWGETITILHRLYEAREFLGFVILDPPILKKLAEIAPNHQTVQTPYIPPRIWTYQVQRLRECIDDFLAHELQIKQLYFFCTAVYIENYGSFEGAIAVEKNSERSPFSASSADVFGCQYVGPFRNAVKRFGLTKLFKKWGMDDGERFRVSIFSSYFNLVTAAGLAYIANFTLQRKEEVGGLRTSCLIWENDEKLGKIPIICGETTKTDPDSDARWVASPSVEVAVRAVSLIAKLRMIWDSRNSRVGATAADEADPYLHSFSTEPWGFGKPGKYHIRKETEDMAGLAERFPRLFDPAQMTITESDLKIALQLTPNLPKDTFAVGLVWPLAWHQYRRTGTVNMFASGKVSDTTMQQLLKHLSLWMSLYYGQGHGRLVLNAEVEEAVIAAMYEAMGGQLEALDSPRFVSPHGPERKEQLIVNLIAVDDVRKLIKWAAEGRVSFREHALGGCMKDGPCELGGHESVASCGGGGGKKACADVLFDTEKEASVRADLADVMARLKKLGKKHPRFAALTAERDALENYLESIAKEVSAANR